MVSISSQSKINFRHNLTNYLWRDHVHTSLIVILEKVVYGCDGQIKDFNPGSSEQLFIYLSLYTFSLMGLSHILCFDWRLCPPTVPTKHTLALCLWVEEVKGKCTFFSSVSLNHLAMDRALIRVLLSLKNNCNNLIF